MRQLTTQDLEDIQAAFPIEHCLRAPQIHLAAETAAVFDRLYRAARQRGPASPIEYTLEAPKFAFLDYLVERYGLLLHGSPMKGLAVLGTARRSRDARDFGDQEAIYATQDSLWAMFYGVLDRDRYRGEIHTGAIHLQDPTGTPVEAAAGGIRRYYYFALLASGLVGRPWAEGAVYLLPRDGFEADPDMLEKTLHGRRVVCTHWMRRAPLQPLAWLEVSPADFPFLDRLWGMDPEAFGRRMAASSIAGFPFLDDPEIYPVRPNSLE
jgi:hypothetical protein